MHYESEYFNLNNVFVEKNMHTFIHARNINNLSKISNALTKSYLLKLTLLWRRPLSYRNQSIHLQSKSMDWFLYDNGLRHERVNTNLIKAQRLQFTGILPIVVLQNFRIVFEKYFLMKFFFSKVVGPDRKLMTLPQICSQEVLEIFQNNFYSVEHKLFF